MADGRADGMRTGRTGDGSSDSASGLAFERLRRPAAWLVGLFVVATVVFWRLQITDAWELRYLNLVLQITLVSSTSLIVALLAIRSFLRSGNWPVLWLAAGSLTYALAIAFSNSLLQWANVNAAVTTHNLGMLLAAILHLVGFFFVQNGIGPRESSAGRRVAVLEICIASASVVVLVALGSVLGRTPPFFIQGQGGTPWRQVVVTMAALLFLFDGLAFLAQYRRSKTPFLFWYALGLLLNALVMTSFLLNHAVGSPLSWLGRTAQIVGGLYLLVATLSTLREARARQLAAADVLASFFWHDEANLKLLFESLMDAIIVTDEHFSITGWNRAAEQVYGWKAEEVIGKRASAVLDSGFASGTDEAGAREELLRGGTWRGQVLHRHREGRPIPVLSTVSTVKDAGGRFKGAVAVNRDITERVRVEDQLRQSEEKTRDLIRYAPTGIYEVDFRTGRFRNVNDAMCAILGYTREELLAMSAFDLLDDAGKAFFADRIRRTLAGEQVDSSVEYRVIKKDGTAIYGVLNVTITTSDGRPDGAFVIAHNVTERRRAAEILRHAAEELELRVQERTADLQEANQRLAYQAHMLENINDMLTVTDPERRLTVWNSVAEELTGWKAEEVLGQSIIEVLRGEWVGIERKAVYRQLDQTGRFRGEIVLRRKDGSPLHTEVTNVAVKDQQGKVTSYVAVNRDITERKRAEEELRASREQARALSHRLIAAVEDERRAIARELHDEAGQLLASLMLGVSVLKRRYATTEEAQLHIGYMEEIADNLSKCMHDLAVSLRPTSLDRVGLASALRQLTRVFSSHEDIRIDLNVTGLDQRLRPELETAIYRIVQEGLTNIVRHAESTSARVTVQRQEDLVIAVIQDDGKGFNLEEAFGRDRLGLSGMRERAEMLGGALSIDTQPGSGTTICAELPVL